MQLLSLSTVQAQVVWELDSDVNEDKKSKLGKSSSPYAAGINLKKEKADKPVSNNSSADSNNELADNKEVKWEVVPENPIEKRETTVWEILPEPNTEMDDKQLQDKFYGLEIQRPENIEEAEQILRSLQPTPEDYQLPLRLGSAVPTANQVQESDIRLSASQISPFSAGVAGGTGNQNYSLQFDSGITDRLQLSGFVSQADDPLFAKLKNFSVQPGNFWESYGAEVKYRIASDKYRLYEDAQGKYWNLAIVASLEGWNVGSGGCDSAACKGKDDASPNIFNNSGQRVFTRNLVGSLSLPLSWNVSKDWQISISPGVSFLPSTQGSGQGGSGDFYGNNVWFSGGSLWRPIPELELFSSALLPFGPGNNSFDENLVFERVPIFAGGITWNMNPRIALEGALTNGWGLTPATSLLALPSSNQLGYSARFIYNSGAADTPQLPFSPRQGSLSIGGLTVNTALVPPDGTTNVWANLDNKGNMFGSLSYSISNIFQLDLYQAGLFNGVKTAGGEPSSSLAQNYTTDGGLHWRVGGKAVALSPLRGAPFWTAGRISLGRNNDVKSYQGYIFAESINTWEANSWLALNINPKIALSGVSDPWGIGISANIQLGKKFQFIPEVNIVGSHMDATNTTFALRWLAIPESTFLDLYISNAAGLTDIAQLMRTNDTRIGGKVSIVF